MLPSDALTTGSGQRPVVSCTVDYALLQTKLHVHFYQIPCVHICGWMEYYTLGVLEVRP